MSGAVWVVIVGFVAFAGQVGTYLTYKRRLGIFGQEAYQHGYRDGLGEGWKGQPDPIGRHQGANDLTRLATDEDMKAWPLLMAESLRPELERLYPGEGK